MSDTMALSVYVDPPSPHFLGDRLFDAGDARLNRDDGLLPYARMRAALASRGIPVHTADRMPEAQSTAAMNHYWSLGPLDRYTALAPRQDVVLEGFVLFEPPLVAPDMYAALPELTRHFQRVFVHNLAGDGYSLQGVDVSRLRKLYWPQPYDAVVDTHWSRQDRQNRVVVIAGNHNPGRRKPELYSERIRAIAELDRFGCVDLYGRGWDRWWSRSSMWPNYWLHRRAIIRAYRGTCESKLATLSDYRFSLCLENMPMQGYITEKIFDCFYAGTVPIYEGGTQATEYLPPNSFIDARTYPSWSALWDSIRNMPRSEWERHRESARTFVSSPEGRMYFASLEDMFAEGHRLRPLRDGSPTP